MTMFVGKPPLILSIFPGIGLLDRAFEAEGFCVVRGPDPLWGGDIRTFHPPRGAFEGVIGGDPCQSHSTLANLVRAKGLEPTFPDLTPEYLRIIDEAKPTWFLRENVPGAPDIAPTGYGVHSFLLRNETLDRGDGFGEEQMRKRRWWFGLCDHEPVDLRRWIRSCVFELPDPVRAPVGHGATPFQRDGDRLRKRSAVTGDSRRTPVRLGGSGKPKRTACSDGTGRASIEDLCELQGVPRDFLEHAPFTADGKRKAIGNGVPQAMGRALARAVRSVPCLGYASEAAPAAAGVR